VFKRLTAAAGAGALLVATLSILAPSTALAYQACDGQSDEQLSQSSANAGQPVVVTAHFRDCNGNDDAGATVDFSERSGPGNCQVTFSSNHVVTDATGRARTTVTLPANCPGSYVLAASTQGVGVLAALIELGGFPNTAAGAPQGPANGQLPIGWMIAAAGIALAGVASFYLLRPRRQV
jgi:ABC-type Fe3+-hydroxamate transport system substrate-binding protein